MGLLKMMKNTKKMNKMKNILAGIFCMFSLLATAQDYKLMWEDNFDKPVLDASNWNVIVSGNGGGNRELEFYRRENISTGNEPVTGESCLIITAKKENYRLKPATSGRLSTQNKVTFKYGKVEARIKMPKTANGLWPAFWMLGNDFPKVVWPKCGEIDIAEMGNKNAILNGTQDRYFNGACHWGEKFNHGKYPNYGKSTTNSYSLQDDFHLYTLIWDSLAIKMFLDLDKYPTNPPYFEMPIIANNLPDDPGRYFHKQFFIIFNLAVGGNFPNIRNINKITALKAGDVKMYVDYVRVYQKGLPSEKFNMTSKIENP
jgi:beta-glucanase (GH16 family)